MIVYITVTNNGGEYEDYEEKIACVTTNLNLAIDTGKSSIDAQSLAQPFFFWYFVVEAWETTLNERIQRTRFWYHQGEWNSYHKGGDQ